MESEERLVILQKECLKLLGAHAFIYEFRKLHPYIWLVCRRGDEESGACSRDLVDLDLELSLGFSYRRSCFPDQSDL